MWGAGTEVGRERGIGGIGRPARHARPATRGPTQAAGQQWRGSKLPSILTVLGCCTTTTDQPSSVGRTQPLEALTNRDQRTRTTYSPGSGKDTVRETGSRATTWPGGEMTGRGFVTAYRVHVWSDHTVRR
jgi:hypothetical protein